MTIQEADSILVDVIKLQQEKVVFSKQEVITILRTLESLKRVLQEKLN